MSVLLVISVILPVPATAASDEVVKIKQQISNTYKKAKAYYGWSSFHGFCGALVNAQLYLLGITDTVLRPDSVVYQYSNENTALTDVDLVILKLLYDPAIRCGMDAEGCSDVIWGRYY
jgi:hypothetical protein